MKKIVVTLIATAAALTSVSAASAVTLPNSNPVPCLFGGNSNSNLCAAVRIRNYAQSRNSFSYGFSSTSETSETASTRAPLAMASAASAPAAAPAALTEVVGEPAISANTAAVPLPASGLLLLLAASGLGLARRRS